MSSTPLAGQGDGGGFRATGPTRRRPGAAGMDMATKLANRINGAVCGGLAGVSPNPALASDFGDLPRVLPVFWLAVVVSFFIAWAKSMQPAEDDNRKRFSPGLFVLYLMLGLLGSCVLTVVLWMFTLG